MARAAHCLLAAYFAGRNAPERWCALISQNVFEKTTLTQSRQLIAGRNATERWYTLISQNVFIYQFSKVKSPTKSSNYCLLLLIRILS